MKSAASSFLIVLVSTGLTVLLCEGILRLTPYKDLLPLAGIPNGYYVSDRDSGYDLAVSFPTSTQRFRGGSNPIWSNNLGCFDMPYNGEQPYIYLTGDSFAWGFSPLEDKWGKVVESNIGVRVLTCGVAGEDTKSACEDAPTRTHHS